MNHSQIQRVNPLSTKLMGGEALTPARMLVNGRSIISDDSFELYDVHHIETASHSILIAEGAPAESYLDTGNRRNFGRTGTQGKVIDAFSAAKNWQRDAAAPLATDRAAVEPIFNRLKARAEAAGLADRREQVEITQDPGLYLVTERGETLHCIRQAEGRHLFSVPAYAKSLRILSRASAPSAAIGPFVDDRRVLGVLVGDAMLWDFGSSVVIDSHLSDANLSGWHAIESAEYRWTTGDAVLNLPGRTATSQGMLGLRIVAAGPYLVESPVEVVASLSA